MSLIFTFQDFVLHRSSLISAVDRQRLLRVQFGVSKDELRFHLL